MSNFDVFTIAITRNEKPKVKRQQMMVREKLSGTPASRATGKTNHNGRRMLRVILVIHIRRSGGKVYTFGSSVLD